MEPSLRPVRLVPVPPVTIVVQSVEQPVSVQALSSFAAKLSSVDVVKLMGWLVAV